MLSEPSTWCPFMCTQVRIGRLISFEHDNIANRRALINPSGRSFHSLSEVTSSSGRVRSTCNTRPALARPDFTNISLSDVIISTSSCVILSSREYSSVASTAPETSLSSGTGCVTEISSLYVATLPSKNAKLVDCSISSRLASPGRTIDNAFMSSNLLIFMVCVPICYKPT